MKCPYSYKDAAKKAGLGMAAWAAEEKVWTYPPDPRIVAGLDKELGDSLEFTPDVERYISDTVAYQDKVIAASLDESPFNVPGVLANLRPYQCSSLRYLLAAKRAILGHDMGVGKTVIAATATLEGGLNKVLLVVPSSAKFHWADHMIKWAGWDWSNIWIVDLSRTDRWQTIHNARGKRIDQLREVLKKPTYCIIMTYDMMTDGRKLFELSDYDVIIFDEAHRLKNRDTQRTEAAIALSTRADHLFLITGTPVRNNYDELWTLLHMIDRFRFSSYWGFIRANFNFQEGYWGGVELQGLKDKASWDKMMSVYMFRKEKKDILPDLPDKVYVDLEVLMSPRQAKSYKQMEDFLVMELTPIVTDMGEFERVLRAPTTIAKIMRLRQICLTPALLEGDNWSGKLDVLEDLFAEAKDTGEKMVVFTMFAKFIPFITAKLDALGMKYATIQGSVPALERRNIEERLNQNLIQIVVGTIGAMGETLNLQSATTAIFTDLDWVPASNRQAEDRIHRLGIKTSPRIIRLIHRDTIEDDILTVLKEKDGITNEAIGSIEAVRQTLRRREKQSGQAESTTESLDS